MRLVLAALVCSTVAFADIAPPPPPPSHGVLSKDSIHKTITLHQSESRACFEKRLADKPGLHGKITVKFIIAPTTGAVSEASVASDTMKDDAVASCLVAAVKSWQFEAPTGGSVTVNYPFEFIAAGGKK